MLFCSLMTQMKLRSIVFICEVSQLLHSATLITLPLLGCVIFFPPNSFYCLGSSFIVYLLTPVVLFLSEDDNLPRYTWMVGESQCHNPCSFFLMKYFFPLNHRNRCSNTTMQNLLSSHFESKQPLQPMEKGPVPNSFTRKFKIKLLCISILAAAYVCLIKY